MPDRFGVSRAVCAMALLRGRQIALVPLLDCLHRRARSLTASACDGTFSPSERILFKLLQFG
jgi:hypothetical protein